MTDAAPTDHSSPAEEEVLASLDDGVLTLVLNRPDKLNALTPDMGWRFTELLLQAGQDPDVRVVVVTGAGNAFCAGADSGRLANLDAGGARSRRLRSPAFITQVPKPVIAAVNGVCVGLGVSIAMMCDIRIATSSARFGPIFPHLGLPAENAVAWALVQSMGYARAFEFLARGGFRSGGELLRLGLVNDVVDDAQLLPKAIELARAMAGHCSPQSLAMIKRQLHQATTSSIGEADAVADRLIDLSVGSKDFREALAAKRERRAPRFDPLSGDEATWWGDGE